MQRHRSADRGIPAVRNTSTKCISAAASTSSCAGSFATPKPPTKPSSRWAAASSFYELSLYKLGWSLYKQEFYEEALHQYFALLDYKVSTGYDFDAKHEEEEATPDRRIRCRS